MFTQAERLKILVPLTLPQITDSRGKQAREQILTLWRMCAADLDQVMESVQPVLTKCRTADGIEIDAVRSTLYDQCMAEIRAQTASTALEGGKEAN